MEDCVRAKSGRHALAQSQHSRIIQTLFRYRVHAETAEYLGCPGHSEIAAARCIPDVERQISPSSQRYPGTVCEKRSATGFREMARNVFGAQSELSSAGLETAAQRVSSL